jgi:hypothetical protein
MRVMQKNIQFCNGTLLREKSKALVANVGIVLRYSFAAIGLDLMEFTLENLLCDDQFSLSKLGTFGVTSLSNL